ncbi:MULTISPECIES: hypothetical protein [unclassified Ensifer]|uniref:hypothetical protein n=1 Tax=unclassified Ensifer TaxID=2633371 RepID=UPI000812DDC0|nr:MULTISPECIES: hypothetical protein [unclassified Ensifer]OCP15067.1 hypothetical protein BC360_17285 [Ensifer sp. LC163]
MAKLWISYLSGLMKLAIILSFAAFTFSNSEQVAIHSSAALVEAAIDVGHSHHCVSAADEKSDHHNGEHSYRKCCRAMCTVLAVLTDVPTLADRAPATTHPRAVWSEPNSFFPPRLYRPPIA